MSKFDSGLGLEIVLPLRSGCTLRCGGGEEHVWGGFLRICDPEENEILYWDASEWEEAGEEVIGAAFAAADKPLEELTRDRKLVGHVWVLNGSSARALDGLMDIHRTGEA